MQSKPSKCKCLRADRVIVGSCALGGGKRECAGECKGCLGLVPGLPHTSRSAAAALGGGKCNGCLRRQGALTLVGPCADRVGRIALCVCIVLGPHWWCPECVAWHLSNPARGALTCTGRSRKQPRASPCGCGACTWLARLAPSGGDGTPQLMARTACHLKPHLLEQ